MNRTSAVPHLSSVALRYRHPLTKLGQSGACLNTLRQSSWRGAETACDLQTAGLTRRDTKLARLEAVLFLAREPMGSRKLARPANLADGTEARTLVRQLNQFYDERQCAFRVEEVAGGFQLMTRPRFGPWLRRLCRSPAQVRLSGPAMETLAVVAYRQPVLRAEIESIRGVQCGEMLRQLMERELVRIVGRAEELGRPFLYGTTRRFLQIFGMRDLDELPRAAALRRCDPDLAEQSEGIPSLDSRDQQALTGSGEREPSDHDEVSEVNTSANPKLSLTELEPERVAATIAGQQQDEELDDGEFDNDDDDDDDELDNEWEEVEDDDEEDEDWEEEDWDDDEEWDEEDEKDEK
jgi:segregation and condensation protein B